MGTRERNKDRNWNKDRDRGRNKNEDRDRGREVSSRGIKKLPTAPHSNLHKGGTSGQFLFVFWVSLFMKYKAETHSLVEVEPRQVTDRIPVANLPDRTDASARTLDCWKERTPFTSLFGYRSLGPGFSVVEVQVWTPEHWMLSWCLEQRTSLGARGEKLLSTCHEVLMERTLNPRVQAIDCKVP